MAKNYYHIDPNNPPTIKEIVKWWSEDDKKPYDPDSSYHLHLPVKLLYDVREVDRAKHEMRAMDGEEWELTKQSLRKKKWLPEFPAILAVGKDGCLYLAGGNHRATLAHKIGLNKAPVRLIFRQTACERTSDGQRGVQIYSPAHSPESLANELTEESDDLLSEGIEDIGLPNILIKLINQIFENKVGKNLNHPNIKKAKVRVGQYIKEQMDKKPGEWQNYIYDGLVQELTNADSKQDLISFLKYAQNNFGIDLIRDEQLKKDLDSSTISKAMKKFARERLENRKAISYFLNKISEDMPINGKEIFNVLKADISREKKVSQFLSLLSKNPDFYNKIEKSESAEEFLENSISVNRRLDIDQSKILKLQYDQRKYIVYGPLSDKECESESEDVQHCGKPTYDDSKLYSIREKEKPYYGLATIEYNKNQNEFAQIKGKGNTLPDEKYWKPIRSFIEYINSETDSLPEITEGLMNDDPDFGDFVTKDEEIAIINDLFRRLEQKINEIEEKVDFTADGFDFNLGLRSDGGGGQGLEPANMFCYWACFGNVRKFFQYQDEVGSYDKTFYEPNELKEFAKFAGENISRSQLQELFSKYDYFGIPSEYELPEVDIGFDEDKNEIFIEMTLTYSTIIEWQGEDFLGFIENELPLAFEGGGGEPHFKEGMRILDRLARYDLEDQWHSRYGGLQEWKDEISGGLADLCKPEDFDPRQVKMGTKVEMEHTDDPKKAMEIALDHLKENPKYYDDLKKIEPEHFNEGFSLGGNKKGGDSRIDHSRQAKRNARPPNPIISGLFESEEDTLDQATYLYENLALTFDDIARILKKASDGNLKAIERADGYTFYITFNNDEVKFARTKSEMKNGGLTLDQLKRKKFNGKEMFKDCRKALYDLERAMYSVESRLKKRIFQDGKIFYKSTIFSEDNKNTIDYGNDFVTIQKVGHYKVDDNEVKRVPMRASKKSSQYLDKILSKIEDEDTPQTFQIRRTAVQTLNAMDDLQPLKDAVRELSEQLQLHDLNGSSTIGDFIESRIKNFLDINHNDLPEKLQKLTSQILSGRASIQDIPKNENEKFTSRIKQIVKDNGKSLLKSAIKPVQNIIQNFSMKILKGIQSAYILDDQSQELIRKLQNKIDKIKEVVSNYKGDGKEIAKNKLTKYLDSIGDEIDSVPLKDIVFHYNGRLYKFNGSYNPIKDILQLYNKGVSDKVPSFKDRLEENEYSFRSHPQNKGFSGRSVAVIPGAFKPPHAGHFNLIKHMLDKKMADGSDVIDEVIILISPKKRVGHSPDNRIVVTPQMSKIMWDLYTEGIPNLEVKISSYPSPVRATFAFMAEYLSEGDTLWVAQGEKDKGDTRIQKLQDYSDAKGLGVDVEVEVTELYAKGVSGAQMRHYLAEGDEDSFKGFLPDHLTMEERDDCYDMIMDLQPGKQIVNEMKIPLDDEFKTDKARKKILNEIAGGVASHGGQMGPMRRKSVSDATPTQQDPHNKPFGSGNDKIKEEARPKGIEYIKSLRSKLKDVEEKARTTNDKDEISSLNKEIEYLRSEIDSAKEKLVAYFVNNFSKLDIDEISAGGAGAVAGTPAGGATTQNQEAVRRAKGS